MFLDLEARGVPVRDFDLPPLFLPGRAKAVCQQSFGDASFLYQSSESSKK
jgi:hypothetical protein